jgi:predicted nucleic acid-binding protein
VIALDSSVAVPLVLDNHEMHVQVEAWVDDRPCALAGHALAETYSVLTRLPRTSRVEPLDVARVLRARFAAPLLLSAELSARIPEVLAELDVSGGAVYDALVGLAAREHECALATLDRRAGDTYRTLGVEVLTFG